MLLLKEVLLAIGRSAELSSVLVAMARFKAGKDEAGASLISSPHDLVLYLMGEPIRGMSKTYSKGRKDL